MYARSLSLSPYPRQKRPYLIETQIRSMHSTANRDKKAPEDGTDLSEYFGVLKDDPLLDKLESDSKKIRELARSRT